MNINKTDNELFYILTGETYEYKDILKNEYKCLWLPEIGGWLIYSVYLESLKNKINLNFLEDVIILDPKILNKLIECKNCNSKIAIGTIDTHHMFCGTYTIIVYNCKNGKILTEDTFKYKETLKAYNGKFKKINGSNLWYLTEVDYLRFKNSVKNIDIIENDELIYSDLFIDILDRDDYMFD